MKINKGSPSSKSGNDLDHPKLTLLLKLRSIVEYADHLLYTDGVDDRLCAVVHELARRELRKLLGDPEVHGWLMQMALLMIKNKGGK